MTYQTIWLAALTEAERRDLRTQSAAALPSGAGVVVIGGGIVGLAIAYFLVKRQVGTVLLVEAGQLCSGASAANAGGIFPGQQGAYLPPAFRELGMASMRLYAELAQEEWAEFDWRQNGSLAVAPERFSCPMADYVGQERARGRQVEHVCDSALRAMEPALNPDITEAVYYPEDGRLNPVRTGLSFAREATRLGATLATGVGAESFDIAAGRVKAVRTTRGHVQADHVVLATGWSIPQLGTQLGFDISVEPAKGQMVATDPVSWRLRTNINSTMAVMQLRTGEIIAGGTVEYLGEDCRPTDDMIERIRSEACRAVPALRDCPLVRAWAGLRPHTPDDMPVIDRAPGLENVLIAAGHFKNGVLLAPITGQLVAEWLVEGRPSRDLSTLRLARFSS